MIGKVKNCFSSGMLSIWRKGSRSPAEICSQCGRNSLFSDLYSGLESVFVTFADSTNLRGAAMYLEGKMGIQVILTNGRNVVTDLNTI